MSSETFRYMIPTVFGCLFSATHLARALASRIPFAWQGNMYGSVYSLWNQPQLMKGTWSWASAG